jgi:hypothetical protein
MTGHDEPTGAPFDPIDAAVDQRLTAATRQARATTPSPDRHTFLAAARTRRDRLRRRRRAWTVATPLVAAALVVVAIGVLATGGDTTSMHASSPAVAEPQVDARSPIKVHPSTGLVDGQTVRVAAYAAAQATFSQCAVVRSPNGSQFYACNPDPSDRSDAVDGHVPAGSTKDAPVARGSLTVHERLRGRLFLLSYPEGGATGMITEASDISCGADTIATVTPVPTGTETDTPAPTTVDRSAPGQRATPNQAGEPCVVMATGLFHTVRYLPYRAPISFAGSQVSTTRTCPTAPGTPNIELGERLFDFTPTALTLCTYGVDGRLVDTVAVPGPDQPSVGETLDYIQRSYVDRPLGPDGPRCADDAVAVNLIGVIASSSAHSRTAWIATAGCTTPGGPSGGTKHDRTPESGSAIGTTEGSPASTRRTPPPSEPIEPAAP